MHISQKWPCRRLQPPPPWFLVSNISARTPKNAIFMHAVIIFLLGTKENSFFLCTIEQETRRMTVLRVTVPDQYFCTKHPDLNISAWEEEKIIQGHVSLDNFKYSPLFDRAHILQYPCPHHKSRSKENTQISSILGIQLFKLASCFSSSISISKIHNDEQFDVDQLRCLVRSNSRSNVQTKPRLCGAGGLLRRSQDGRPAT